MPMMLWRFSLNSWTEMAPASSFLWAKEVRDVANSNRVDPRQSVAPVTDVSFNQDSFTLVYNYFGFILVPRTHKLQKDPPGKCPRCSCNSSEKSHSYA